MKIHMINPEISKSVFKIERSIDNKHKLKLVFFLLFLFLLGCGFLLQLIEGKNLDVALSLFKDREVLLVALQGTFALYFFLWVLFFVHYLRKDRVIFLDDEKLLIKLENGKVLNVIEYKFLSDRILMTGDHI